MVLICISLMIMVLIIFSYTIGYLGVLFFFFFLRNGYPGTLPCIRLFSCYWAIWVWILYNNLSDVWFSYIFSQSIGHLHILLIFFTFTVQKFFSLMQSYLFTFASVAYASSTVSKKNLLRPLLKSCLFFFYVVSYYSFRSCV